MQRIFSLLVDLVLNFIVSELRHTHIEREDRRQGVVYLVLGDLFIGKVKRMHFNLH